MNPSEPQAESSRAARQQRVRTQALALLKPGAMLTPDVAAQLLADLQQCVDDDKTTLTRAARSKSSFVKWRQKGKIERNRDRILQFLQDKAGLTHVQARFLLLEIEEPADGRTRLVRAARNGDIETVQHLVGAGVDPSAHDDLAIARAARNGHLAIVQFLLGSWGVSARASANAFVVAARSGQAHVVRSLLNNGNLQQNDYDLALYQAVHNGYIDVVDALLAHGTANPIWRFMEFPRGQRTALEAAVRLGRVQLVQRILADERITSVDLAGAIGVAAQMGRTSLIPLLMAHPRFVPGTNLDLIQSCNLDAMRAYYSHPECRKSIDARAVCYAVCRISTPNMVDVVWLLLACVDLKARSEMLKAEAPDGRGIEWGWLVRACKKEPLLLRSTDCMHVLLKLPLEHVPTRTLFNVVRTAAQRNINTEALLQLQDEGQLLAVLRDVFKIRLAPPSVDVMLQARAALRPFATASRGEPTLQAGEVILDARIIPDLLYALAPALPQDIVRDIWKMLRAEVKATLTGSPVQRMRPALVRNVIVSAVDLALSKYNEAQKDAATLADRPDADLKPVAQRTASGMEALGRTLKTADAHALSEAHAIISANLPEYERQIVRALDQEALDRRAPSFDLLRSIAKTPASDLAAFAAAQKRQRQAKSRAMGLAVS